jgi:hypothetical protein
MAITREARPRAFRPEMEMGTGTSLSTPGWDPATERRSDDGETLARALGWLATGLGAVSVAGVLVQGRGSVFPDVVG